MTLPRLKRCGALSAWPGPAFVPSSSGVRMPKGRTRKKDKVRNRTYMARIEVSFMAVRS
jgi:hypothetical protein